MSLSIPSDIASYLTPDEKIMMMGKNGGHIYATNKRLIFKNEGILGGKEIVEASYRHISSIEYGKKSSLGYVIAGICVVVLTLVFRYSFANFSLIFLVSWDWLNILAILLILLGVILIVIGVALSFRPPVFTIHIVGREPIMLKGKKLEGLIKIIRQYREEIETPEKVSH